MEISRVPDHVLEKMILLRLDVEQLGVCKCVCKSWHSIISDPYFTKAHLLNHSHNNNDPDENIEFRDKRIFISHSNNPSSDCHPVSTRRIIGSANGLVCFYTTQARVLVVNPTTREVREVERILVPEAKCWGFGYDSSTDDYKVVVGFEKDNKNMMCFQVLTLKSNVWRVVGEVKYTWIEMGSVPGTLCNGALHWLMNDQNNDKKIVSFCLSREEFKEIPQPDDPRFKCADNYSLGISNGCLCLCRDQYHPSVHIKWIMRNYNVKESWELLPNHVVGSESDLAFCLLTLIDYIPYDSPFCVGFTISAKTSEYTRAPLFVRSLVSPHVNGRSPMRSAIHVHVRSKWMWNFFLVALADAFRWFWRQLIGGGDGDIH